MVFMMEVEGQSPKYYVYANQSTYQVTGVSPKQVIGKTVQEVFHKHPEMSRIVLENYKQVIQQRQSATYRGEFTTPSGKTMYTDTLMDPIISEEGTVTHVLALVRNITQLIEQQEEIEEKNVRLQEIEQHYESIIEHNNDGVWFTNKDWELVRANQALRDMLGVASDAELNELRETSLKMLETTQLEKIRHHQSLVMQGHLQEYQSYWYRKDGQRVDVHIKAVPVVINGEVQGLYGFAKDITEQKQVERELRESKERYRSLFDHNMDAVWSLDLDGNFTSANRAFEKILGISSEILCTLNLLDFDEIVVTSFEDIYKNFEAVKQEKSVEYDLSMYRANGEIVHLKITSVPIYTNGKVTGLYGIGKDVTDEVNAEKALRESEKRYRLIADNMNDLIAMYDIEGTVKYASPSYQRVLGVNPEEYVGQHATSLIHEEDKHNVLAQFAEAVQHLCSFTIEFRKRTASGEYLHFETLNMPVCNDQGVLEGYVSVSRDITDRKAAEAAMCESEERYRLIADNSHDLIRVINANQEVVYISPSYQTVLGFAPEEMMQKNLFQEMHPEDKEALQERFNILFSTKQPQMGEFRRQHRDGHWVWLEAVGTPVLDKDGTIKHIVIVSRDVSKRKQYEEQLQHLAFHDALTNLPNRRLFVELAKQSLKDAERTNRKVGIMYLDLDKFKEINDNLGHDVGDELLVQFTKRVKENLRKMDILCRMGGDEFTILLPKTEKLYAKVIAQRILEAIQQPYHIQGYTITTTSSIGIAVYPEHGDNMEELIKRADYAMYQAKANGRNGIYLAEQLNTNI